MVDTDVSNVNPFGDMLATSHCEVASIVISCWPHDIRTESWPEGGKENCGHFKETYYYEIHAILL